jgi:hypothetical protein
LYRRYAVALVVKDEMERRVPGGPQGQKRPADVTVEKMSTDARQTEVDQNLEFFLKELPRLSAQRGKYALIRHQQIVDFFQTPMDALTAGNSAYPDRLFSIQQVTDAVTDLGYYSHAVYLGAAQ